MGGPMVGYISKLRSMSRGVRARLARVRGLARLSRSASPPAALIARAIDDALARRLTPGEKTWVDRLEELRSGLVAQTDRMVTVTDYGAGNPGDNLTAEEMAVGKISTRSVGQICLQGGTAYQWRLLFFRLIRSLGSGSCVELGTSLGMSAAYQAAALELNGSGQLTTLEGADALAKIADENFRSLGLSHRVRVVPGRFRDTLVGVLREVSPVDFAFIDGHHDESATLEYFDQFLPHLAARAVLLFDDIIWYEGLKRAWQQIAAHPRVQLAVDMGAVGLVVISDVTGPKEYHTVPLRWPRASAKAY